MNQHPVARPNVLFVLADDLGQGDVSCYNPAAEWTTMHLDRLAAEGMRFTDSHATSALCTPSRYSALTGRYSWRSRLKCSVLPGDSMALVEKDRLTMPEFLRGQGYRTAVVGKWHLGLDWQLHTDGDDFATFDMDPRVHPRPSHRHGRAGNFDPRYWWGIEGIDINYREPITFGPNELGFDHSFITAASLDQPPYVYIEDGRPLGAPTHYGGDRFQLDRRTDAHQSQIQKGPMTEDYDIHSVVPDFQARTIEVLDDMLADDAPWFLYVPSHLVHGPIIPNTPWQGRSGQGPYGDFVLQFDDYVGQLVERIDRAGAANDTIVVVTSDNGASGVAGLPTLRERGHDPSNGWRGHKSDIWEGGHREPFIVRWPGHIEAATTSSQLISHSDLFATLADLLGQDLPEGAAEDSTSNLPLWLGREAPVRTELVSQSGGGGLALRRGPWKLQCATTGDGMDAAAEAAAGGPNTEYRPAHLFNLAEDPTESHDLFDDHPAMVAELTAALADVITGGGAGDQLHADGTEVDPNDWPQIGWI